MEIFIIVNGLVLEFEGYIDELVVFLLWALLVDVFFRLVFIGGGYFFVEYNFS